ncbi:MAG: DUF6179 domain-containing protein [Huintestinicola sp.]
MSLLSDTDITKLQSELLVQLAEQCEKWNHGESSSVPTEKAQEIMTSILFVIGIKLKSCQSPEQAVELLRTEQIKVLFESGLQIVRRKISFAVLLQKRIADNLLETTNVYYRSTIVDGINGFFKMYDTQFSAHEIHITADYPVFAGRPDLNGIEFIEQYLRCIEAENKFCVQFRSQDIHHLLCGLTQDYRSVPMNLFEYVMLSALGLVMSDRDPQKLDLSEKNIEKLYRLFSPKTDDEIMLCLKKAMLSLRKYGLLPSSTERYLEMTLHKLVSEISKAVKTKTLDKVFLVPSYPEREVKLSINYGERMNDRKYRKLVERLLQTEESEDKAALILQEVHSLADLLEILSDAELYEDDLNCLICMLPLPTYAALLSEYPCDDFLKRESELLLYKALQNRKYSLSSAEMEQLNQIINAVRTEVC